MRAFIIHFQINILSGCAELDLLLGADQLLQVLFRSISRFTDHLADRLKIPMATGYQTSRRCFT